MKKKSFDEIVKNTRQQIKWWSYAAWTFPFVALAIIGAEFFFEFNDLLRKTLVAIGLTFFSLSVFWWWWAIFKIKDIVDGLDKTVDSLIEVKDEIVKTRKILEDSTSWDQNDSSR